MQRILWWLRRDLRLTDNVTLAHALRDAASVIPVFILDPRLMDSKKLAPARKQFLFDSLRDLDVRLQERGGRLIIRRGDPAREVGKLVKEMQVDAVYFHRDYTPYARHRDERVRDALNKLGVRIEEFDDNYLASPEQILKNDGTPYVVFTRYRLRFEEVVGLPKHFSARGGLNTPREIPSLDLPTLQRNAHFARGGETEGLNLVHEFMRREDGLARYRDTRDRMAQDSTSHLSPHLHLGTVSVRELARKAREADAGQQAKTWIDELVWREFYASVLWHYPHAAKKSFRPDYENIRWENDAEKFDSWRLGLTGYPIIDAAMRQLNESGWMHNRARMVVASFLTKDLLIDWRWGEEYFLQHLIDGDVASNNGGWQWAAGTGTDAQPFFRIFNPMLQGARFDPEGEYVTRWVPDLAGVPAKYIHAPWTMPRDTTPIKIGKDYPMPIVNHVIQRERALAMYRRK